MTGQASIPGTETPQVLIPEGRRLLLQIIRKLLGLEKGVTWEAMALTEAWGNLGGGNQVAQVGTDTAGKVYIRGIVKSLKPFAYPATNIIIGTLPEGKRPKEVMYAGLAWIHDTELHFSIIPVSVSSAGFISLGFGNSDIIVPIGNNGNATYLTIPQLVFTRN